MWGTFLTAQAVRRESIRPSGAHGKPLEPRHGRLVVGRLTQAYRKIRRWRLTHDFPFDLYVDHPLPGEVGSVPWVLVQGWIAVPTSAEVEGPWVECGPRIPLARSSRPDVQAEHPEARVVSFEDLVAARDAVPGMDWMLAISVDGKVYRTALPVAFASHLLESFEDRKRAKLARLEALVRCPHCRSELSADGVDRRRCSSCGQVYERTASYFDFLTPELRADARIDATDHVSAGAYGNNRDIQDVIDRHADGLLLDVGAGMKSTYFDNVVNLEIVDYPSSDVLGVAERLPFADESFEGALSLEVLEHVRDPFAVASEIARVVKPGGTIYIAAPHLAPYHGYPHHYYNMTRQGLEALFSVEFDIERSYSPDFGQPMWALNWFLTSYARGLPPDVAERFRQMRVEELMGPGRDYLARDFVVELSADVVMELATNNAIIATKRS